jgi:dCTP deaminase
MYERGEVLSTVEEMKTFERRIDPEEGWVLLPGELYLGATVEWTSSGPYLPVLDGTSGAGRLGISVHQTAGLGDVGFEGHWTLELTVIRPVFVFGGEPLAQLRFFRVQGQVRTPYREKSGVSYADARDAGPVPRASRMWRKRRWLGSHEGEDGR